MSFLQLFSTLVYYSTEDYFKFIYILLAKYKSLRISYSYIVYTFISLLTLNIYIYFFFKLPIKPPSKFTEHFWKKTPSNLFSSISMLEFIHEGST